jgi:AcrR family transcriptional regulator
MPRVPPEYKAQAKARIVRAGLTVFLRNGYRSTTMQDIAREAGVSKGDLYLYIRNKVDLLKEVQLANQRQAREWMTELLGRTDTAEALVTVFDRTAAEFHNPNLWVMWFELFGEALTDPSARAALQADHRADIRMLEEFLDRVSKGRSRRGGASAEDVARAVLLLFHGAAFQLSLGTAPAATRRALRAGLHAVLGT